jgi:hypothetical protein
MLGVDTQWECFVDHDGQCNVADSLPPLWLMAVNEWSFTPNVYMPLTVWSVAQQTLYFPYITQNGREEEFILYNSDTFSNYNVTVPPYFAVG